MAIFVFSKMRGDYYVRLKSYLIRKRVKHDPRFRRTMLYAELLATASRIASAVYKVLPIEFKGGNSYRKITGQIMRWLKEGKTKQEIWELFFPKKVNEKRTIVKPVIKKEYPIAEEVLAKVFRAKKHERSFDLIAESFET